jgi:hypothetical protein
LAEEEESEDIGKKERKGLSSKEVQDLILNLRWDD